MFHMTILSCQVMGKKNKKQKLANYHMTIPINGGFTIA